jgi:glycosyltransferase involved in cell wall biosynthesis
LILPQFTIITATYNSATTLATCLDSVKRQSVDLEHILVDGGSTDDTLVVANCYRDHLAKIVSEPDQGIYDAMNKGIGLANGDVIGTLNADDLYPDDEILARVAAEFNDPAVQACYGGLVYINSQETNNVTRYWRAGPFDRNKMYWGWMPPHPTFFVRADVYQRYGLFNLELGSAADYEIMLRFLLKHQIYVAYIPSVLVHMRTGGVSNATLSNRLSANRMDRKAWTVNELKPYPWTLAMKPLRKVGQWVFK